MHHQFTELISNCNVLIVHVYIHIVSYVVLGLLRKLANLLRTPTIIHNEIALFVLEFLLHKNVSHREVIFGGVLVEGNGHM